MCVCFSHFDKYVVGSHCYFILNSIMRNHIEYLFIYLCSIYVSFLVKYLDIWLIVYLSCLFSHCFKSSLYVLDTRPLSECVLEIFSPSLALVFHFLSCVFCKTLVFFFLFKFIIKSNPSFKNKLCFWCPTWKSLVNSNLCTFLIYFIDFIVLHFIIRSMIHFKFILKKASWWRGFLFCFIVIFIWTFNHSSTICWKDCPFFMEFLLILF